MKKIFLLLPLFILLISCDENPVYNTDDTNIQISVVKSQIYNSQLTVNFIPDDDEVYYITGIIKKSDYNSIYKGNDNVFMQQKLDSTYKEYLQWAASELKYNPNGSIAKFRNKLTFSVEQKSFTFLNTNTDYIIYAFVVNPDDVTVSGKLYKQYVKTANYDSATNLKLDLKIVNKKVQLQPSDLTAPYYCSYEITKDNTINEHCEENFFEIVKTAKQIYHLELETQHGFQNVYYDSDWSHLYHIYKQYIYVVGYDNRYTTPLYIYFMNYDTQELNFIKTVNMDTVNWERIKIREE